MEEFFYISHNLTDQDRDGCVILCYELMMEAEHRFRIKWGGGVGCHRPLSYSGNAPPCSRDMLERVAWNSPDSKTLERLVWSVYDGILSPGPTPKLMGPESYNQVTRHLAAKVFRGLQVCCLTWTSAQFDEPAPVRVWSVIFATPPSEMARKPEATEAMDTTSQKVKSAEEGAVGGEADADPNRHPMAWMCDCQCCYEEWNDQLLAVTSPTHGWRRNHYPAPCTSLAINLAMVLHHTPRILPSHPNQHGDRAMAAPGQRGKQGRSMDRGLRLLLTTCGRSICQTFLGNRGWGNGSRSALWYKHSYPGKMRKPVHWEGVLAVEERYHTKAAYEQSPGSYNLLSR